jgi:deoxyribodipyrimidine photo-lyase
MSSSPVILWLRNDLRLHDHPALTAALNTGAPILPIYVWDSRLCASTPVGGFPRLRGPRALFLQQSLLDLRQRFRQCGAELWIRQGDPPEVVSALALAVQAQTVVYHIEPGEEELQDALALETLLAGRDCALLGVWGNMLYEPNDLPFAPNQLPDVFTHFRRKVESSAMPRVPLLPPVSIPYAPPSTWTSVAEWQTAGVVPDWDTLAIHPPLDDPRAVLMFEGGETAALARLQNFIWTQDRLRNYKETRNGMLGEAYSSKFSPWLAHGCLSPRWVYAEIERYEQQRIKNDSTYWLGFELLWRDYFRLVSMKFGPAMFAKSGIQGVRIPWQAQPEDFARWATGQTGFPLVDACMTELAATGYMSNRGRQIVASFLTKNLGMDWRLGAEWFESHLIDYDVYNNYGNWNYTAGVGNDARGFRYFNIPVQAQKYDPQGAYVYHWLPVLQALSATYVHQPWALPPVEQAATGFVPGQSYPLPMIDLEKSVRENEAHYGQALRDANFKVRRSPYKRFSRVVRYSV